MKDKGDKSMFNVFKSKKGIAIVVIIIACISITAFFVNKFIDESNYRENLKKFYWGASKTIIIDSYICEDLRKVWREFIYDDKEYFDETTGTFSKYSYSDYHCDDFSEAVNKKIQWNEENLSSKSKSTYREARVAYMDMTPPPSKYKDAHVYVKQMFKAMTRLHDLSTNPTGNLATYSNNVNETVEQFTSSSSDLSNEFDFDLTPPKNK